MKLMEDLTCSGESPMAEQCAERRTDPASQGALDELEAHVQGCLGGRVRDFHVVFKDRGLVLSGQSRTYHAKQLAQQRVMETTQLPILANEIEVA
jgi:hypothetical protein